MSFSPAGAMPGGPVLQNPRGLATAVVVLLGVVAATDLFAVYADLNVYSLMSDAMSASQSDLDRGDSLFALAGALQTLAILAAGVVFIIWFHRVRSNAEVFAQDVCTMGKGWAIGSWFIPIGNLWLPHRVARQTWHASTPQPADPGQQISHRPVNAWWITWLVAVLIGRAGAKMYDKAVTPDALKQAVSIVVIGDVLDIAAAALAILFVRKLTGMQHVKAHTPPAPVTA